MSGSEVDDSFSENSDVEAAAVEDTGEEGWANAMAKILGKQGKDDYVVLSKTKVTVDEVIDKDKENEMKNKVRLNIFLYLVKFRTISFHYLLQRGKNIVVHDNQVYCSGNK